MSDILLTTYDKVCGCFGTGYPVSRDLYGVAELRDEGGAVGLRWRVVYQSNDCADAHRMATFWQRHSGPDSVALVWPG